MSEKSASGDLSLHAKIRTAINAADLHYEGCFTTEAVHGVIVKDAQIARALGAVERAAGPRVARIVCSGLKRTVGDVLRHEAVWIPNKTGKPIKHRRFLAHRGAQTQWVAFYRHDARGYGQARAAGERQAHAILHNLEPVQIMEQKLLPFEDSMRGEHVRGDFELTLRHLHEEAS